MPVLRRFQHCLSERLASHPCELISVKDPAMATEALRDASLPGSSTATASQSPDDDGREQKKRRKVLSCIDCRRRKLQ